MIYYVTQHPNNNGHATLRWTSHLDIQYRLTPILFIPPLSSQVHSNPSPPTHYRLPRTPFFPSYQPDPTQPHWSPSISVLSQPQPPPDIPAYNVALDGFVVRSIGIESLTEHSRIEEAIYNWGKKGYESANKSMKNKIHGTKRWRVGRKCG
jgi:hypothetical protein